GGRRADARRILLRRRRPRRPRISRPVVSPRRLADRGRHPAAPARGAGRPRDDRRRRERESRRMSLADPIPLLFLVWLLVLLPLAAIRSAGRMKAARQSTAPRPLPSRETVWLSTPILLTALGFLAWAAARVRHERLFSAPRVSPALAAVAALAALGVCLALRALSRALRSPEERRRLAVYTLAPRTRREWVFWSA